MNLETVIEENCLKLWQPPLEREVNYYIMFSAAANYTAKKLNACIESGQSQLEKFLAAEQERIIAAGLAPEVVKRVSEIRSQEPYIVKFCSQVLEYSGQALSTFGVAYTVKAEKPALTILSLQTPIGDMDMPVKLTRKPGVKDPMKRQVLEVQAFFTDLSLLLDGIESTVHSASQHVTSKLGNEAPEAARLLYKPYNL